MRGRLRDKRAFITSAASGIGEATARRFAAEGAHVAVVDRDTHGVAATVEALRTAGVKTEGHEVDVTHEAALALAVDDFAAKTHGH